MASEWGVELGQNSDESTPSDIEQLLNNPTTQQEIEKYGEDHIEHGLLSRSSMGDGDAGILVDSALRVLSHRSVETKGIGSPSSSPSDIEDADECLSEVPTAGMVDALHGMRRSGRTRQKKRSYSPVLEAGTNKKKHKKIRRAAVHAPLPLRPYDRLDDGKPFCCDLCKSPYVCNPSRRGNCVKRSKHQPSPRQKIDPVTHKLLTLCNACGLMFDRPKKPEVLKVPPPPEEKEKYLEEARTFAQSLVEGLNDTDAERLACPHYKNRPCGCLQRYIMGDGTLMEASRERATQLLCLLKKAKSLRQQKAYNLDEVMAAGNRSKKGKNIGLGNGQKRSRVFEDFVKRNRHHLREDLKLCERACQRVLMYSNNFLHKKLKTEEQSCRAERVKGQAALGLLPSIAELHKQKCCVDNCVMLAVTHNKLLQSWRERARSGQTEARRVLGEMLTPSGGLRANCYKFIQSVTGCSYSTISNVSTQMKRTGGDREPPQHGLKKFYQKHPKRKSKATTSKEGSSNASHNQASKSLDNSNNKTNSTSTASSSVNLVTAAASNSSNQVQLFLQQLAGGDTVESSSSGSVNNSQLTSLQIQAHRQQILLLQRQLAQQQLQLQQQQQLLQQQLIQQVLIENVAEGIQPNSVQVQTLQSLLQLVTQQLQQAQGSVSSVVVPSEIQVSSASQPSNSSAAQVVTLTTAADWQPYLQQVTLQAQDSAGQQQVPQLQLLQSVAPLSSQGKDDDANELPETPPDQPSEGTQQNHSADQQIIQLNHDQVVHPQDEERSFPLSAELSLHSSLHPLEVSPIDINESRPISFPSDLSHISEAGVTSTKELVIPVNICNISGSEASCPNILEKSPDSHTVPTTEISGSLMDVHSPKSLDSSANIGATNAAQTVIQQILELSQLSNGTVRGTETGVPQLGINLTQAQTTQLLAQLAECGNTVAPNVNIALVQQEDTQLQAIELDQIESQSEQSVNQGLASNNCTVVTIEPQVTGLIPNEEEQSSNGHSQVCSSDSASTSPLNTAQLQLLPQTSLIQGELPAAQLEIVERDGNHFIRLTTINEKGESADVVLPLVDQPEPMDR